MREENLNDKMNLELSDKRVLVTGASRGIGSAIAEGFLKEGAKVCITSRGSERLFETEERLKKNYDGSKVLREKCDCTDPKQLSYLAKRIQEEWKSLDVLIANVGDGQSTSEPLPDHEQWEKVWNTNFESALQTSRVFLPMLQESKGTLLFIASITGLEATGAPVDYSTAKTAVIALAKNMARKLGNAVRVNVVAPGNVMFPDSSWEKKLKENPEKVKEIIKSNVPMNRFGKPEEIANATIFLCSEKASFITGSFLVIDGGQTSGII